MTESYSDRARGRQPGARENTSRDSLVRPADRLLIASFEAAGHAEAARIERFLRQSALRLLASDPPVVAAAIGGTIDGVVVDAIDDTIDALWACSGSDSVFVAVACSGEASLRVLRSKCRGTKGPAGIATGPSLQAAAFEALAERRALEHPTDGPAPIPPGALAEMAAAGVGSLRWSVRPLEGGAALVLALQVLHEHRYWPPACRLFHEGVADILAAVARRGRWANTVSLP